MIMTNEQSIKIIRELLVAIDNGGVLYGEKEKKELKEALGVAIESLGAKYVITDDGNIYPLPKNPFPDATTVKIPPIIQGEEEEPAHLVFLGNSPHDGNMYKCSKCGETYSSWEFLNKTDKDRMFTCRCGAKWVVP